MSKLSRVEDIYAYLTAVKDIMACKVGKLLDAFNATGEIEYLDEAINTFALSDNDANILVLN